MTGHSFSTTPKQEKYRSQAALRSAFLLWKEKCRWSVSRHRLLPALKCRQMCLDWQHFSHSVLRDVSAQWLWNGIITPAFNSAAHRSAWSVDNCGHWKASNPWKWSCIWYNPGFFFRYSHSSTLMVARAFPGFRLPKRTAVFLAGTAIVYGFTVLMHSKSFLADRIAHGEILSALCAALFERETASLLTVL